MKSFKEYCFFYSLTLWIVWEILNDCYIEKKPFNLSKSNSNSHVMLTETKHIVRINPHPSQKSNSKSNVYLQTCNPTIQTIQLKQHVKWLDLSKYTTKLQWPEWKISNLQHLQLQSWKKLAMQQIQTIKQHNWLLLVQWVIEHL